MGPAMKQFSINRSWLSSPGDLEVKWRTKFKEWGEAFPNRLLGASTLDRLRDGAYRVILEGESYRKPKPLPKGMGSRAAPSKSAPVKRQNSPKVGT